MPAALHDAWATVVPDMKDRHGPLPPLMLALTVVTGLVDAFSYLVLGHVFVANMTGNVVFSGFAIAGAAGFSLAASSPHSPRSPRAPCSAAASPTGQAPTADGYCTWHCCWRPLWSWRRTPSPRSPTPPT